MGQQQPSFGEATKSQFGPSRHLPQCRDSVAIWGIVLQKSKVAGPRIFRENTKREAATDSYNLNRIVEVACELTNSAHFRRP
jgi:hypothetical protein